MPSFIRRESSESCRRESRSAGAATASRTSRTVNLIDRSGSCSPTLLTEMTSIAPKFQLQLDVQALPFLRSQAALQIEDAQSLKECRTGCNLRSLQANVSAGLNHWHWELRG